jgi:hypothetical protein
VERRPDRGSPQVTHRYRKFADIAGIAPGNPDYDAPGVLENSCPELSDENLYVAAALSWRAPALATGWSGHPATFLSRRPRAAASACVCRRSVLPGAAASAIAACAAR